MKKDLKRKSFRRRTATAMALAVFVALLTPSAGAQYADYIERVAQINEYDDTPIDAANAISNTEANNVMIYLMNRMYPVGSIYMTTDITSPEDMETHFGGAWIRFAQGRIPVGATPILEVGDPNYAANSPYFIGEEGGTMGGDTSNMVVGNIVPQPVSFSNVPDNDTTTTNTIRVGAASLVANSGFVYGTSTASQPSMTFNSASNPPSTAAGTYGFRYWTSTFNVPAFTPPLLQHSHTAALTYGVHYWDCSNGSRHTVSRDLWGGTNHVFNITTNVTGTAATISPTATISIPNSTTYSVSHTFPGLIYTPPTVTYTAQQVSHTFNVTISGQVHTTDTTVQPYMACYMYMRTELAGYLGD